MNAGGKLVMRKKGLLLVVVLALAFLSGLTIFVSDVHAASFGYDTIGTSSYDMPPNYIVGYRFTLSEVANITAMSAYLGVGSDGAGLRNWKMGIYNTSLSFQGETQTISGDNWGATSEWKTLNFSTPLSLAAADYFLCIFVGVRDYLFYYDAGTANYFGYKEQAFGSFPNPIVWDGTDNWKLSINASYVVTGGGDSTAPTYSDLSVSSTVAGASAQFNATFNDETDLTTTGSYIFSTNNTGSWINETAVIFTSTPQTVSVSKTLNSTVGLPIGYNWFFNDTAGNWNTTGIQTITLTDGDAPTFGAISADTTVAGASVSITCAISDNAAVSGFIASWNNTGSWANGTWTAGGSGSLTGTFNSTVSYVISVKFYANDTSDNWGVSSQQDFTLSGNTTLLLTLQVRDKDGSDIARVFSITGTLANGSSLSVNTDSSGQYSLSTINGTHTFAVVWGSMTVNASVSVSATENATVNLNTRIEYFASGSSYILWAITSTDLPSAASEPNDACKLSPVSFSAAPTLKVDVADWVRSTEPTYVNVGGYRFDKANWAFSSGVLTYTLGAATDTFIILEWGDAGGGSGGGSSSGPSTPGDSGEDSQDGQDVYVPLPERTPEPKPFVMPAEVTQAVIVAVAALAVVGLLGYVYQARKAQAEAKPSWSPKTKEAKRKWQD